MSITRSVTNIILLGLLYACGPLTTDHAEVLEPGIWRMELDLMGEPLPFNFTLVKEEDHNWTMVIQNGDEMIEVQDIRIQDDSIFIRMPLYDSEFKGIVHDRERFTGIWRDHMRPPEHAISFTATAGEEHRFDERTVLPTELEGTWEVDFSPGTDRTKKAIGIFEQRMNGRTTGTFVTETGDHRYLEGIIAGDTLRLSAFDGTHAYLYSAVAKGDSLIGTFRSGIHWQEPWIAVRNPDLTLDHPDSLTAMKEGHSMVDFRFPDLDGNLVSPQDPQFNDKPLLVQIMGSWCPNCVDETRLLNDLYEQHRDRGLEVIAIAFEKHEDPDRAIRGLKRFREALEVEYPILYAGRSDKGSVEEQLPFLDRMMSFPTCIYIDHTGVVRRIRTGFYGPGTGEHHKQLRKEIEWFVERLVAESHGTAKAR